MRSFSVFVFLFFLSLPGGLPSAQAGPSGEEIFVQGKCVRCHTLGRGRFVGPDLLGVGRRYSRDDLIRWARDPESIYAEKNKKPVNEGYPPMPPMNLSESDARKVADYLLSYESPPGLSESGTIKGRVKNVTTGKPEAGRDVVLISYMGDRKENRHFAKSDSMGNFSFSSLKWDRSYEIVLFHQGVQYVSGKMVFLPGEDGITLDLPVYDTTTSDENISLRSLNLIVYPDNGGADVNVTSFMSLRIRATRFLPGSRRARILRPLFFRFPKRLWTLLFQTESIRTRWRERGKSFTAGFLFFRG